MPLHADPTPKKKKKNMFQLPAVVKAKQIVDEIQHRILGSTVHWQLRVVVECFPKVPLSGLANKLLIEMGFSPEVVHGKVKKHQPYPYHVEYQLKLPSSGLETMVYVDEPPAVGVKVSEPLHEFFKLLGYKMDATDAPAPVPASKKFKLPTGIATKSLVDKLQLAIAPLGMHMKLRIAVECFPCATDELKLATKDLLHEMGFPKRMLNGTVEKFTGEGGVEYLLAYTDHAGTHKTSVWKGEADPIPPDTYLLMQMFFETQGYHYPVDAGPEVPLIPETPPCEDIQMPGDGQADPMVVFRHEVLEAVLHSKEAIAEALKPLLVGTLGDAVKDAVNSLKPVLNAPKLVECLTEAQIKQVLDRLDIRVYNNEPTQYDPIQNKMEWIVELFDKQTGLIVGNPAHLNLYATMKLSGNQY